MSLFTVKDFVDAEELKTKLSYSLADLSGAMVVQASTYVHYGLLQAKASKQVKDLELLIEIGIAKVKRRLRDAAAAAGVKVTQAELESEAGLDEKIIELRRALNEALQVESKAKTAVKAFEQRRDMLIQHGSTEREEMRGELSIKTKALREAEVADQQNRILAMRKTS